MSAAGAVSTGDALPVGGALLGTTAGAAARARVGAGLPAACHAAICVLISRLASTRGMADTSAAPGMFTKAPWRSRLMLPSNAEGLARKIAIINRFKSDLERAPARHAMPRSVALAPIL